MLLVKIVEQAREQESPPYHRFHFLLLAKSTVFAALFKPMFKFYNQRINLKAFWATFRQKILYMYTQNLIFGGSKRMRSPTTAKNGDEIFEFVFTSTYPICTSRQSSRMNKNHAKHYIIVVMTVYTEKIQNGKWQQRRCHVVTGNSTVGWSWCSPVRFPPSLGTWTRWKT